MKLKKTLMLCCAAWLFLGCFGTPPVTSLQLDKPTRLLNLEKTFGIESHMYGGFLSGSSGYTNTTPIFSFAIEVEGRIILLTYPSKMFTFDFSGKEPTVTLIPTNLSADIDINDLKKHPTIRLMAQWEDGEFKCVRAIHISLPASMRPENKIQRLW